jgi:uncharacterized membrane protein YraQ (UPF0718 family)
MDRSKIILCIIMSLIIGIVIGYMINTKTAAKFNTINATCTTLNIAVDNKMLTAEEVRKLGQLTKKQLGESGTAKMFQITPEQIRAASPHSNCSQYMVGMSE